LPEMRSRRKLKLSFKKIFLVVSFRFFSEFKKNIFLYFFLQREKKEKKGERGRDGDREI